MDDELWWRMLQYILAGLVLMACNVGMLEAFSEVFPELWIPADNMKKIKTAMETYRAEAGVDTVDMTILRQVAIQHELADYNVADADRLWHSLRHSRVFAGIFSYGAIIIGGLIFGTYGLAFKRVPRWIWIGLMVFVVTALGFYSWIQMTYPHKGFEYLDAYTAIAPVAAHIQPVQIAVYMKESPFPELHRDPMYVMYSDGKREWLDGKALREKLEALERKNTSGPVLE